MHSIQPKADLTGAASENGTGVGSGNRTGADLTGAPSAVKYKPNSNNDNKESLTPFPPLSFPA